MFKRIIKKVSLLSVIGVMTIGLTGCGEKIINFANTTLNSSVLERIGANKDMLRELKEAGFLNSNTYSAYMDSLSETEEYFKSNAAQLKDSTKQTNPFIPAINKVAYIDGESIHNIAGTDPTYINDDEGKEYKVYESSVTNLSAKDLSELMLINYLGANDYFPNIEITDESNYYRNNEEGKDVSVCDPLILIENDVAEDINERFKCPVYVLNPDMLGEEGIQTLDEVVAAVGAGITIDESGVASADVKVLDKYFAKAKDSSGNEIKLLDNLPDFNLVIESRDQTLQGTETKPGYDTVVKQDGVPCFTVKYKEIDSVAYDNLKALIGINNRQYVYYPEDGGRMYLLEYPVSYIESIQNQGTNKAIANIERSGIGVNLYTKEIIKYEPTVDADGNITWSKDGTVVSNLVDSYLTVEGAPNQSYDGQSAFIINGEQDVDVAFQLNKNTILNTQTLKTARIVLRDYLEATYAPEMVDAENLVVFGRKIRFNFKNFTPGGDAIWDKKDIDVAYYVDKDGKVIDNTPTLKITDFCSTKYLMGSDTEESYIRKLSYEGETTTVTIPAKDVEEGIIKTITDLKEVRVAATGTKIDITDVFPGPSVGKADFGTNGANDNNSKQRFYIVATSKGIFDSGLYNTWINVENQTASLDWWNKYLSDNNFVYKVEHQDVNDYLLANYAYELSETGIVILDLDTIRFIQEQMDDEAEQERSELIRTIFIVFGWFLISYSIILVLAWIFDTNSDVGIDLLNKLTLGNWIAIKYPEDIPGNDLSNTKYVSASGISINCIILIAVGILIINVDVFKLVLLLIETFGTVASEIEKIIKGLR